jgi:hypothetical protein
MAKATARAKESAGMAISYDFFIRVATIGRVLLEAAGLGDIFPALGYQSDDRMVDPVDVFPHLR